MLSRLLALLQLLLLLRVLLRELLRLLLMLLLKRLLLRFIGGFLWQALMILLLFCLERLAFLDLLRLELVLLLLIFLIRLRITCIGSDGTFRWLNILGMHCRRARTICVGGRASSFCVGAIRLVARTSVVFRWGRGGMNGATLFGGYCSAFLEAPGLGCSRDGGLPVIRGST